MLQSMKRIQVIGPKEELNRVVDLMYQAGTIHLENASEEVPLKEIRLTPVKLEAAQNIADVLSKIQAIFSTLPELSVIIASVSDRVRTGASITCPALSRTSHRNKEGANVSETLLSLAGGPTASP